jgi:ribosome maturation factor RimP
VRRVDGSTLFFRPWAKAEGGDQGSELKVGRDGMANRDGRTVVRSLDVRSDELRDQLEPLLASRGFALVEVGASHRHGSPIVTVVIHRPQGVSLADCEAIARLVRRHPVVAPLLDDADMEVCSPGVDRKIRDEREYVIFAGRGIRILRKSGGEWIRGRIEQAADGSVTVSGSGTSISVPVSDIKRAFLDHTQEVRT